MKPLKDTSIGKFLSSKGLDQLLEGIGEFIPGVKTLDRIKDAVLGDAGKLSEQERKEFLDLYMLNLEELDKQLADRDSARRRDAEVQSSANATRLSKNVPPILAMGTTILTFILFGVLMVNEESISQERREITIYILGVLSAVLTQVFGFYFGSSQGSMDKNSTIRQLTVKSE